MAKSLKSEKTGNNYHHGELRATLLKEATKMVKDLGIQSLSMRALGESIGVSRTALYHHFKNKNDLLSAIAESGFTTWQDIVSSIISDDKATQKQILHRYIKGYIEFSTDNAFIYELMFGSALWKEQASSESLKSTAYKSFQFHLSLIERWQKQGLLNSDVDTLRLAQVTWGTLHGICKLIIDGIYADNKNIDHLVDTIIASQTH
ncbi:TetR/AcrR family transcriptional regulator [Thalassomonas sp. M1454]|uniref:TetR/AcrR family transcriptional regulator n=1 Tax=Thalassomonas sp. M1454 TaxID=2594477 RepID=UPI00117E617B|nr:TetR/AcrR family transcriptional regulator [Thalassomonas sp. M1454]TRX55727.1 TetR/AcrR family transcriptional regulator [Thalassomonas sp. M1454]